MNEGSKKIDLLGREPVPKALLAMGLPIMAGMMINAFYNLADAYFVGRLGTNEMGAITAVFPLGQAVVGLGLLFGNGAASCLSRLLGKGDQKQADKVASTALWGSILTGAAVILCVILFLEPILRQTGATEKVMPYAVAYGRIYVVSCIFQVFNVAMNNIVSSEGAAKMTMGVLITGAALNVALDPVFLYVLDLGVVGAGAATVISQMVSTGLYTSYILRKRSIFDFDIKNCCFSRGVLADILKIGIPTLLFQILTSLSIAMINSSAAEYGEPVMAAMGVVTRIMSMGSLMVFGFLKGLQPVAGYSYGAKNYRRLYEAIRISILWSTIFCLTFGLIAVLFSEAILSGFTKADIEMIQAGEEALRANGLSFMLFGYYTVYSSVLLALGKAGAGFFLGACRQGICFVPAILLLPAIWGVKGIFYAQPLADVLSAGAAVFIAVSIRRKLVY